MGGFKTTRYRDYSGVYICFNMKCMYFKEFIHPNIKTMVYTSITKKKLNQERKIIDHAIRLKLMVFRIICYLKLGTNSG